MRTIIDISLDGIIIIDDQARVEFGNDSFFRIVGWPREEIIGNHFIKLVPDEDKGKTLSDWDGFHIYHGRRHETRIRTKNGEIKYLSVSGSKAKVNGKYKIMGIVHDITENIRLEKELKKSGEKYREIFENDKNMHLISDENGRVIDVNNATVEALGCASREEVLGTHFSDWYTPESAKIAEERKKRYQAGEPVSQPQIFEVICKTGEHKWFEVKSSIINENGRPSALHATANDVTEKIRLERELKESEEKYKELYEKASDGMYMVDTQGYFLSVNNAALRILQCNYEDIVGSHVSKWLTEEGLRLTALDFEEHFSGKTTKPKVREVIAKSGEHKWVEMHSRVIKDKDEIIGIHGVVRDVTEKVRLEKELRESEEKYRDLFENAQDVMYVVDDQGVILKMNRVGLEILGAPKEEIIGKNISKWMTKGSLKKVEERRKKQLSGEQVSQVETLEIVCKNGEHRWAEIKTREIRTRGKILEIHGIARDITENVLLKNELKKSSKHQKLLCYLVKGTRGGRTRALILKHLGERSYNANQLATVMNMDYKTIRHHLKVLMKNGIIAKNNDGYTDLYFIPNNIKSDLDDI